MKAMKSIKNYQYKKVMKIKLFFMLALAIAMLTASCGNKEKAVTTYSFNDGTTITKYQKGNEVRYDCDKGTVEINGNILVVKKPNAENFTDQRNNVKYFSAVYNVNLPNPILSFDEYYVVVKVYPQSGLVTATKGGNILGHTLYTLRTFDGNMFVFPRMDYKFHYWYTDVNIDPFGINDNTGEVTMTGRLNKKFSFTLEDVKPWLKDGKIYFKFDWYDSNVPQAKSGGEYRPFVYGEGWE